MGLFDVVRFDEVPSTNEGIKRAIEEGAPEGLVHRAVSQSGGYGRQGRTWSSPEGGLYQSILLRPEVSMERLPTIGLVVGLAIREALQEVGALGDSSLKVKWPNDIMAGDAKLAGISNEHHAGGICIGIGVNVFPGEGGSVGGKYVPAFLSELSAAPNESALGRNGFVDYVGDEILASIERRYDIWKADGFSAFSDEFLQFSYLQGKHVEMIALNGAKLAAGEVTGVDAAGNLLLLCADGAMQAVSSGEAHIVSADGVH